MSEIPSKEKSFLKTFQSVLEIKTSKILLLIGLSVIVALSEGFGVALLLPVLEFVEKGEALFQNQDPIFFWKVVFFFSKNLNIPINLITLLIFCFTPIILRQVFFFWRYMQATHLHQSSISLIRSKIFKHIMVSDLKFIENESIGNITGAMTLEAEKVGNVVFVFTQLLSTALLLLGYLGLLFIISAKLTGIAILSFFFIELLVFKQIRETKKYGQGISENNKRLNFFLNQRLSALKLIKLFKTEKKENHSFKGIAQDLASYEVQVQRKLGIVQALLEPTLVLASYVVLYVAVTQLQMTLASLGIFLFIFMRILPLSKQANSLRQQALGFRPSFENINNLLTRAKEDTTILDGETKFTSLAKEITFDRVTFSYNNEKNVLKDLNLTIPAGKSTALVGQSGSGKSTIIDLIVRLRDPQQGQILFDGLDLKTLNIKSLRENIGYVSQETFLFNDTIKANIKYGHPGATDEDVQMACKLSHCLEFINNLPDGLETHIGDRGSGLSGGQKQRINFARALLSDPQILILDEPTSALDSESEKYISQTIQELKQKGKTIIIIAHRFSTIRDVDQIIVMEHGEIKGKGFHEELIENNKTYSALYNLQSA